MRLTDLKVGDKITVDWREICTIVTVGKTSVTDSRGTKWTAGGRVWGSSGGYGASHAWVWEPSHDEIVKDAQRKNRESHMRNKAEYAARTVSYSALERICAIVDEDLKKEPASC